MCRRPPDGHSGFYKVVTSWLNLINYVYIYIYIYYGYIPRKPNSSAREINQLSDDLPR